MIQTLTWIRIRQKFMYSLAKDISVLVFHTFNVTRQLFWQIYSKSFYFLHSRVLKQLSRDRIISDLIDYIRNQVGQK